MQQVFEPSGASQSPSLETDYTYDSLDDLLQVDQYGGMNGKSSYVERQRKFTYDSLSRLTQALNPESGWVCYGTTPSNAAANGSNCTPGYDANGNLTAKTDARGVNTSFTYDVLNRLTKKTYSDGATPIALFVYDTNNIAFSATQKYTTSNVTGRLSVICVDIPGACQSMTAFSYDKMGRVAESLNATPSYPTTGAVYSISALYDLAGNLTSMTYPDGRVVTQTYDSAARLQQGEFASANGTAVNYPYVSAASYFADGSLESMNYGNGATETLTRNNRLQPTGIKVTGSQSQFSSEPFFNKTICYLSGCGTSGTNGRNIQQITDSLNSSAAQIFSYDTLNRLATFHTADNSTMVQTYTIDPFGNLDQVGGTLSSGLSFDNNNHIMTGGYSQDTAGNVTAVPNGSGGSTPMTYDAENRITNYNSGTATYLYDADGNRIHKNNGGGYTEYIEWNGSPLAEIDNNGNWSDNIYANGQRIATSTASDRDLGFTATFSGTGQSASWAFPLSGYTIQSGDVLCFRQTQSGGVVGGIHFGFTDGTNADNAPDENGLPMAADGNQTESTWQLRTINLMGYAGKQISSASFVAGPQTPAGTWFMFFAKASIVSTSGKVTQIYNQAPSISLSYSGTSGVTGASSNVGTYSGHLTQPVETTNYYASDQVGSARVEIAGEGRPVSTDVYYAFGQEPAPPSTLNIFKFTGKERDSESGNDYFGARYYSSAIGRFLSPDWSAKAEPVPYAKLNNPQSLDLYGYMANNPLSGVDADGHDSLHLCTGAEQGAGACSGGEVSIQSSAQQQMGDPTLPTEVQPPPSSTADKLMSALMPKTPLDLALLVGTDGLGELGAALSRALELSSAMGKTADFVTLAVTETKEGTSVVSSSEKALRPAVRALLKPGEVAANGAGHAEVTGVNAARQMGLTPTGVAASRGICPSCADFLRTAGCCSPECPQRSPSVLRAWRRDDRS